MANTLLLLYYILCHTSLTPSSSEAKIKTLGCAQQLPTSARVVAAGYEHRGVLFSLAQHPRSYKCEWAGGHDLDWADVCPAPATRHSPLATQVLPLTNAACFVDPVCGLMRAWGSLFSGCLLPGAHAKDNSCGQNVQRKIEDWQQGYCSFFMRLS